MNEVERLLAVDKAVPIPEAPDLRYTEAAVLRRLGSLPARATEGGAARRDDWALLVAAAAMVLPVAGAMQHFGISLRWLLFFPLALLILSPILLTKEQGRS